MNAWTVAGQSIQGAWVQVYADRLYGSSSPVPWLLTLVLQPPWGVLQVRAVVDDFGNLVPVTPWH